MVNQTPTETFDILIVEDSSADADLLRMCLVATQLPLRVHRASDGAAALEYLHRAGYDENTPVPHLIFLDLNLPRKDGREVLRQIRSNPRYDRLPTIVLSTSNHGRDVDEAYALRANAYLAKPPDLEEFEEMIQCAVRFWLGFAKLPPRPTIFP